MPFRITIEKFYPEAYEYWTNVYFVQANTLGDAGPIGSQIVQAERTIHGTGVIFTKMRVDDNVKDTEVYSTVNLNLNGQRTISGDLSPLFVTQRVDMNVTGGRPSRKFYRGVLSEGVLTSFGRMTAPWIAEMETFCALLGNISGLVDVDGQEVINVVCAIVAANRQLRRGSKKKNTQSSGGIQI